MWCKSSIVRWWLLLLLVIVLWLDQHRSTLASQYYMLPLASIENYNVNGGSSNNNNNNNNINYSNNNRQHPSCALILRRFKGGKLNHSYAPSFKAMLQALRGKTPIDTRNQKPLRQICITYEDVNKAIEEAMYSLQYSRPDKVDSLEPPPEQIAQTAEVIQEVTRLLTYRFKLSHDEILNGLPLIDMSRTIFWSHCPATFKPMACKVERYRTPTAHCNNLDNPSWGATNTPFVRYLPPVYSNGIDGMRESVMKHKGGKLPHPRLVTRSVHRDVNQPSTDMTILFMSHGQLFDHDMTLANPPRFFIDGKETEIDCCRLSKDQMHPLCMPFDIPPNDYVYGKNGALCHDFKRSIAGHRPNCALGPRVHVNILSAPIDAGFIYGSTQALANRLRSYENGMLKIWDRFAYEGLKPLLPQENDNPDLECFRKSRDMFCFLAGDTRVNEQIHLTVLHTLYMREHNRMALELGRLNPHWDDEKIYQETRHIIAAMVQHILMREWLPLLIGPEETERSNLTIQTTGYWYGYNPKAHTSSSQAFTTAAFRMGHTFIQGKVRRYNKYHEFLGDHHLRFLLRRPWMLYEPGMMDQLSLGLVNTPAQSYDSAITKEISGHLFQYNNEHVGLDLPAVNLMRGREQGVPGYNFYREWCGLKRVQYFDELIPWVGNRTAYLYSQLYAHPDDIDLWSGGISEFPVEDGLIGPTFACIIGRQFANLKNGDRFWYENPGMPSSFTPSQLQEIRKVTLAKLICENGDDIETIQRWVFKLTDPVTNPRVKCEDIPDIDLRFFQDDSVGGGFSNDEAGNEQQQQHQEKSSFYYKK